VGKFIEAGSRLVVAEGQDQGEWAVTADGYRFLLGVMKFSTIGWW
jgi:hypothetical protein